MLDDRIEDVLLENRYLRKRVEMLEKDLAKRRNRPMIAQYKTTLINTNKFQQWNTEIITPPTINGVRMVNLTENQQSVDIGVAGFYNVIIRFGFQYQRSGSSASVYHLYLNDQIIAESSYNAYQGGSVSFNEYLELKKDDHLKFHVGHVYNRVENFNHFTIIKMN